METHIKSVEGKIQGKIDEIKEGYKKHRRELIKKGDLIEDHSLEYQERFEKPAQEKKVVANSRNDPKLPSRKSNGPKMNKSQTIMDSATHTMPTVTINSMKEEDEDDVCLYKTAKNEEIANLKFIQNTNRTQIQEARPFSHMMGTSHFKNKADSIVGTSFMSGPRDKVGKSVNTAPDTWNLKSILVERDSLKLREVM
jgi:hypothetical protein